MENTTEMQRLWSQFRYAVETNKNWLKLRVQYWENNNYFLEAKVGKLQFQTKEQVEEVVIRQMKAVYRQIIYQRSLQDVLQCLGCYNKIAWTE